MRFSLANLLLAMTLTCVLCVGAFATPPPWDLAVVLGLSATVLPSLILTGCLFSCGAARAFFIGMAASIGIPLLVIDYIMLLSIGDFDASDSEGAMLYKLAVIAMWALGGISGAGAAWIY